MVHVEVEQEASPDDLLTIREAAKMMRVCERTVMRFYQEDGLAVFHLPGNITRLRRSDVIAFYEQYKLVGRRKAIS